MVIPAKCPGAAGAAAVAQKRKAERGAAEPAELIRHARAGRDLPARGRRARRSAGLVAQEEAECAALTRRQREPPRRREVDLAADFGDDGRQRAAFERLLHGEQRIDGPRDAHDEELRTREPDEVEAGAI